MPRDVVVTHDGTKAYVAGGSGVITVVNTETEEATGTISAGTSPYDLTMSPDGTKVYVADYAGDRVYIIFTATDVVTSLPVGDGPRDIAMSSDGRRVYVANRLDGTISIINTEYGPEPSDYLISTTVTMDITPDWLAITPDGSRVFVVDYMGLVQIYDTLSCTFSSPVWVGMTIRDIAITQDGNKAYLVEPDINSVEVLDTSSCTSLGSITVGGDPYSVAITPDGTRAYVTNRDSGSVSVISTDSDEVVETISLAPWSPWAAPAGLWISRSIPEITLTGSPSPSVYGQVVRYTATVAGTGSTPTGMVIFKDGTTAIGANTVNGAGESTIFTWALPAGTHQITALYQGDSLYGTATSPAFTQTVDRADTVMALTSSDNPTVYGQPATFTATVSAVAPNMIGPAGTVTFLVDGTPTEPVSLFNGVATYTTSSLPVGSHTITATYADVEGNYNGCSGSLTGNPQLVDRADTALALASSLNPSVYGQPVTLAATVSAVASDSGTPVGTVTFYDDGSLIGTATLSEAGVAALTTSALPADSHTITASYAGDGSFNGCAGSLPDPQVVDKVDTTQTLVSSANPSVYGQPITFTATITATAPGGGTPAGTVTFLDGGSAMGTATLSAGGVATLSTGALSTGSHTITATYAGDGNFAGCTGSLAGSQTVNADSSAVALTASPSPGRIGQPVTLTATVTGTHGTPAGAVEFLDGGSSLGAATISGGTATFTTSGLSVGTHTITAAYPGDTNYQSSSSLGLSEVILPNPPVADFTANLSSGVSPVTIRFTDTSLGSPISWAWNFGDGSANSTEQNPAHSYTSPGTYTVTLTVANAGGSTSLQRSGLIMVRAPASGAPLTISMDQMYSRLTGLLVPSPSPLPSSTPVPAPTAQAVAGTNVTPTPMPSSVVTPSVTPNATTGSPLGIPMLLVLGVLVVVITAATVTYLWVTRK